MVVVVVMLYSHLLEELVKSILQRPLYGISKKRGRSTRIQPSYTLGLDDLPPPVDVPRVELPVDLTATFHQVEGGHRPVGDATGHESTECAFIPGSVSECSIGIEDHRGSKSG